MKTLIAPIEDHIKTSRTSVSSDVSAGNNAVISVPNGAGFAINDYICVGYEGSQTAELAIITAVTDISITVSVLKLGHKASEPITKYLFNKRKFYGSLDASTWTELTSYGSPADILVDNPQGTTIEYTGIEGYIYFKATYYNSTTTDQTSLSDSDPVQGDESLRYCSIYDIRQQAQITQNPFYTDARVEAKRRQAENEVKSYIMTRYTLPLQRTDGTREVPFLIQRCAILLAAGYIDYEEHGAEGEGVKWLGEGRGILKSIKKGDQRLLDTTDNEMAYSSTSNQMQGFPTMVDNDEGSDETQQFTMTQTF